MKCPKCGFVGFDHLDSCKKCGADLAEHKTKFGIRSLFGSFGRSPVVVPEPSSELGQEDASDGEGADFGFDFLNDDESTNEGDAAPPDPFATAEETEEEIGFAADSGSETDDFRTDSSETASVEDSSSTGTEFEFSEGEAADDFDFEEIEPPFDEDPVDDLGEDDLIEEWEGDLGEEPLLEEEPEVGEEKNNPFEIRGMEVGTLSPDADRMIAHSLEEEQTDEVQVELFASASQDPVNEEDGGEALMVDNVSDGSPQPFISFAAEDLGAENGEADLNASPIAMQETIESDEFEESEQATIKTPTPSFLGARMVAGLFDLVIVLIVFFLFVCCAEFLLNPAGDTSLVPQFSKLVSGAIPYFLVLFSIGFTYFTLFHYLLGQTPGKMSQHLRLESENGGPLLFSQAFLHSVGGLVCMIPVGIGFLTVLLSPSGRGWNDRFAGSRVVKVTGVGNLMSAENAADSHV